MKVIRSFLSNHWQAITATVPCVTLVGVAGAMHRKWLPAARGYLSSLSNKSDDDNPEDPPQSAHNVNSLELSEVAWKNIGLKTGVVQLQSYVKTVSVPAIVVERPGRSQVDITAPFTGIVTRVYPIEGESLRPGQPLFELRLTHEDLVTAQRDFLRALQEFDVVEREFQWLTSFNKDVVEGGRIRALRYDKDKLTGAIHAQRQGLLLHGLTVEHVDAIIKTRELLQRFPVEAPPYPTDDHRHDINHQYHVQKLLVKPGQHVAAGDSLAVLADHCELYIEGQAFEEDAPRLIQAARDGWSLAVSPVGDHNTTAPSQHAKILYVADHIDPDSRALRFYLSLPNELIHDDQQSEHRFVAWKYRPGQRMEVKIPISQPWKNQVVLPSQAVVEEGAEAFVFEQNGDHFDRVPVHVIYRDKEAVVIENNGALIGSTLAMSGAYQMHLALKNKAGGGVDPHAGHSH